MERSHYKSGVVSELAGGDIVMPAKITLTIIILCWYENQQKITM